MKFYEISYRGKLSKNAIYPCFTLIKDGWNDFGYYTLYKLYYNEFNRVFKEIGYIKILQKNKKRTTLPESFEQLPENYCSLGNGLNFYRNLVDMFQEECQLVLSSLNDCATNEEIQKSFEHQEGFVKSLLRFSDDEKALKQGKDVISGISSFFNLQFTFSCKVPNANEDHVVNIDFTPIDSSLPNRIFSLIGKNGTGKTQFLGKLALGMSGQEPSLKKKFIPGRPLFSRVISVSYSLFDNFEKPISKDKFSYYYCGFKDFEGNIISANDFQKLLRESILKIIEVKKDREWIDLLSSIIPVEKLEETINQLRNKKTINIYKKLDVSSGQGIILNFVSQVLANITEGSLILFDEPEMHLHPNAISQLINILYNLLDINNSYAILATHSPIIIQQIPARYVRVFDRSGNVPIIKMIDSESFGENLSTITDEIFGNINEDDYYKYILKQLRNRMSSKALFDYFNGRLSLNAKIYFESKIDENA